MCDLKCYKFEGDNSEGGPEHHSTAPTTGNKPVLSGVNKKKLQEMEYWTNAIWKKKHSELLNFYLKVEI